MSAAPLRPERAAPRALGDRRRAPAAATPPAPSGSRGGAASVAQVRKALVDDLEGREVRAAVIDEAEIVVSELVSNAIRHARPLADGNLRVHWKVKAGVVEVEVTDGGGDSTPAPGAPHHLGAVGPRPAHRAQPRPRVGRHRGPQRLDRVGLPRRPLAPPQPLTARPSDARARARATARGH